MVSASCLNCLSQSRPLFLLKCCLDPVCSDCLQIHNCATHTNNTKAPHPLVSLEVKSDNSVFSNSWRGCDRCQTQKPMYSCSSCSNRVFCEQCYYSVHSSGKFTQHQSKPINSLAVASSSSSSSSQVLECDLHPGKHRNLVLQNCSLGCHKCSEDLKLRKVSIVQDFNKQNINSDNILAEQVLLIEKRIAQITTCRDQAILSLDQLSHQIVQDFQTVIKQLNAQQAVSLAAINAFKNQEVKAYEETLRVHEISKQSLNLLIMFRNYGQEGRLSRAPPNPEEFGRIVKAKRALVNQILKKEQRKKQYLQSYEFRRNKGPISQSGGATKNNMFLDSVFEQLKNIGGIEKAKLQKEDDQKQNAGNGQHCRSTSKLRNSMISIDQNNNSRIFDRSNIKAWQPQQHSGNNNNRSKSKDTLLNTSHTKQKNLSHQRNRSSTQIETLDQVQNRQSSRIKPNVSSVQWNNSNSTRKQNRQHIGISSVGTTQRHMIRPNLQSRGRDSINSIDASSPTRSPTFNTSESNSIIMLEQPSVEMTSTNSSHNTSITILNYKKAGAAATDDHRTGNNNNNMPLRQQYLQQMAATPLVSANTSTSGSNYNSSMNAFANNQSRGIALLANQKSKNDFLHLRESVKKGSGGSYLHQHRPSLARK